MDRSLIFAPEVRLAVDRGERVVALESTILSHGMPYPQNLETASSVERIVREHGAVPATIAVLDGRIHIGLTADELHRVARAQGMLKVSRADLAHAISMKLSGSTTVAATMIAAEMAEIRIFATGGIGGVHRGAEHSMDISSDLDELARTDVAVVCAGAKAILDLPKTLEALETRGVPVIGFQTREFPAFWSRSSGLALPMTFADALQAGEYLRTKRALGIAGGVLIAVPVPHDAELPADEIEQAIDAAVAQAREQGVTGKALTPWLLDAMLRLTAGRSLAANIALVRNNAAIAADIAVCSV